MFFRNRLGKPWAWPELFGGGVLALYHGMDAQVVADGRRERAAARLACAGILVGHS
jgi:hypothetical protein